MSWYKGLVSIIHKKFLQIHDKNTNPLNVIKIFEQTLHKGYKNGQ